jgi:hypothetical protein
METRINKKAKFLLPSKFVPTPDPQAIANTGIVSPSIQREKY